MSDLIQVGNGMHGTVGGDNVLNSFGVNTPNLMTTGIHSQQVTLIELQKYNVPLLGDMKTFAAKETPFLSILMEMSGKPIDAYFKHWTDDYEGDNWVDIQLDKLRVNGSVGYNPVTDTVDATGTQPLAIGHAEEIGGEMIWQKASIKLTGTTINTMTKFNEIADGASIDIRSLGTTEATKLQSQLLETGIIPSNDESVSSIVLGFNRGNTHTGIKYDDIIGQAFDIINKLTRVLRAKDYVLTEYDDISWNGGSATKAFSLKYVANTSKRVMAKYDNIETAIPTAGAVAQNTDTRKLFGIDQFIYDPSAKSFVIILDADESNLDFQESGSPATVTTDMLTADTWYQVVEVPDAGLSYDGATYKIGDIFYSDTTTTITANANAKIMAIPYAILMEEVNTALPEVELVKDGDVRDLRIFGVNNGGLKSATGHTRLSRHVIINMHKDVPSAVSEAAGFGNKVKTGYNFDKQTTMNYMQLHNSDTWKVTTFREGTATNLAFKNDYIVSRERHMREYKQDWNNIIVWGKQSNAVDEDNYYKGSTSGLFDREVFPIQHFKRALPFEGGRIPHADSGAEIKKWMEDIGESLNANKQFSIYDDHTLFVSQQVMQWLRDVNARLATSGLFEGANRKEASTGNTVTLGLEVDTYRTQHGTLKFVHNPLLDQDSTWKMARYLYPHTNGKVNPRFLILAIDKSHISMSTHKSRPHMLHGNLQENRNPFISEEGMSGSGLFELRFPGNHAVIDITPNW